MPEEPELTSADYQALAGSYEQNPPGRDERLGEPLIDPGARKRRGRFPEHSSVTLLRDLPAEGLAAGAGAYEVEFFSPDGQTVAVVTVAEADLQLRRRR